MTEPPHLKVPRAATPGPGLSSRSRASYGLWVTYWPECRALGFALRLGVEKVVHHRDDDGHALHQRDVGGVGQDGQARCGARLHVAVDLAALQAEHLRDMFEPYDIAVTVDEEHRCRGGLELVSAEVVPTRSRGKERLDDLRKVVRGRAQLLVFYFTRVA